MDRTCVKIMITIGRDCGSAKWINHSTGDMEYMMLPSAQKTETYWKIAKLDETILMSTFWAI